ncbi:MAG: Methionyl-tRNA formyltransferase [Phycisphaerae bacterium]|nr:Methionyl-tRNA formyltransferase [Phycisphaerae bacterium]
MSRKKAVVFGHLPIASRVLNDLHRRSDVEVVAVVGPDIAQSRYPQLWDYPFLGPRARELGIPRLTTGQLVEQFAAGSLDFGFVCRFAEILKPALLERFSGGVVNMHGGFLPQRAGVNICCHVVILGDSEGGATLHFVDAGVDSGDIIAIKKFPVSCEDTAFMVEQRILIALWELYLENVEAVLAGKANRTPQRSLLSDQVKRQYFSRDSLLPLKELDIKALSLEEIDRRVRGFEFPGHEPAYFWTNGHKVYLTTAPRN